MRSSQAPGKGESCRDRPFRTNMRLLLGMGQEREATALAQALQGLGRLAAVTRAAKSKRMQSAVLKQQVSEQHS
jgi:hypothetical protein